jgi:phenylalanyl-tRNA synthetase beta chain
MKLLLSWLRDYVDVDLPVPELARRLIDSTAEVEGWETIGSDWDPERIRVAEVVSVDPHPNADKLRLVTVEAGAGQQQVVCGAPNVAVGQKVAFATEGAALFDGHTGKPAVLRLRPIRGVDSAGMVLSERELGLSEDHEGILVLPDDAKVGRPLTEQLGDVLFDISTWANRADLLGVLGFAREVSAITSSPLRQPDLTYGESDRPVDDLVSVTIEDPDLCRRFTASVIEGVQIGPSPAWMQERLQRMGMRPINNVVDITNYVMLETGQPIHAFDYDLVRGRRIVARRAKPGERLTTLDGVDRELDPEMLMICDGEGPVGIAGIMGGGNSEVSDNTRTVLLEVANFLRGSIRRTSSKLKLRTEASLRFEKGIGPDLAVYAQRRALHLFEQCTGGRVAKGLVDIYPTPIEPPVIMLPLARVEQVLGMVVPRADIERILLALGFTLEAAADTLTVTPPYWRPDVEIADDVVEEIGRIYGYDQLPATSLRGSLPPVEPRPLPTLRERLRDLFVGVGFQEVITYSLTDEATLAKVVAPGDHRRLSPLRMVNPVASQHGVLRTSMRGSLLQTAANNRHISDAPLRLFEIGFEYLPTEADLPHERPVLCGVIMGPRETRWGRPGGERLDFFDAKGALEAALDNLGIASTYRPLTQFGLLEGHTAEVTIGSDIVGVVAQVHPQAAGAFGIDESVFLVELYLEDLVRHLPERPEYTPPPRYPDVRHDIALLVDVDLPAGRVLQLVRAHRSGSVRIAAEVFDEYRGKGVPEAKKSLAVSLRYRASDRTLTDEDVARIQQGLLTRLQKELGAALRGA